MKIEQLLVQYLYNNKSVSIQDIGHFTISPEIAIPLAGEKEMALPDGAILFEYDKKATQDEGLIAYIVDQTRKIRPLAVSDLESYGNLSRQFLNIGKPMVIEGLGTLVNSQEGGYEFIQGKTVHPKLQTNNVIIKEKIQDDISFKTPERTPGSNKGLLTGIAIIFILSAAAAIYYFTVLNKDKYVPVEQNQAVVTTQLQDTAVANSQALIDSTNNAIATRDSLSALKPADGAAFKIVLKDYSTKQAADNALKRLTNFGHNVVLVQKDSVSFSIAMPFTTALSDTTRAVDSLRRFFGGKPYVQR